MSTQILKSKQNDLIRLDSLKSSLALLVPFPEFEIYLDIISKRHFIKYIYKHNLIIIGNPELSYIHHF